jgi:hypothetical protein
MLLSYTIHYLCRTALAPPPNTLKLDEMGVDYYFSRSLSLPSGAKLKSTHLVAILSDGTSFVSPATHSINTNQNSVEGFIVIARNQTLDGITWKNVTFVNTHISYDGGDLHLENVRFVNCTFEAPANKQGTQFARFAVLVEPSFTG